ncbi:mitochondrial ribosomal death-associated protein 3-domain-containing protein [Geopyxis carbonaria]|nr:mitochondrial ribosomal death-associated protein 3-domain-containing protein [Geopyxis carbonaria]
MLLTPAWRHSLRAPASLLRPAFRPLRPLSTTAPLAAGVKAQKAAPAGGRRAQVHGFGKKGGPGDAPKKAAFAEGERRALRNRIVLSNTNAPPVDLEPLSLRNAAAGEVYTLADADVDRLRALQGFRRGQFWGHFAAPSVVVREECVVLREEMERAVGQGEAQVQGEGAVEGAQVATKTARVVLDGVGGSGKSIVMLQAMVWALQMGWVVLNIPNAQDLVLGHTDYDHDAATNLWSQREYTCTLLSKTLAGNKALLEAHALPAPLKLGSHPPLTTLAALCSAGAKDPLISHEAFTALLQELETSASAPPVLFACDGFNHLALPSKYRTPEFTPIHAHDLALPAAFVAFLNGARSFASGGLVLAATTAACARTEALEFALRNEALPAYSKLDSRIAPSVEGAAVLRMDAMGRNEAEALLEYCRRSGLVPRRERLPESEVTERIAVAGGLPAEIVRGAVRIRGAV